MEAAVAAELQRLTGANDSSGATQPQICPLAM